MKQNDVKTITWPGIFKAFSDAWGQVISMRSALIPIAITYLALGLIRDLAEINLSTIATLVFLVAIPAFTIAAAKRQDKKSLVELMTAPFNVYLSIFVASILFGLVLFVGAIPLLIPLAWLLPKFILFQLVAVDQKLGPIASLKKASEIASGNKKTLWGMIALSMLIGIIITMLTNFSYTVALPLTSLATLVSGTVFARYYLYLTSDKEKSTPEAEITNKA